MSLNKVKVYFLNPARPAHLRHLCYKNLNLNFYFHFFVKTFQAFIKPFEAPQRSMKIKI